jgi:hypothetical protein
MAYGRPSPAKWIAAVVALGVVGGLVWACVELGKSPFDLFGSKPPPPKPARPSEPPKEAGPAPVAPKVETPAVEPPRPAPELPKPAEPVKPAVVKFTRTEFDYLKDRIDKALAKGDLPEARKRMDELESDRLPDEYSPELAKLRERLEFYLRLIAETDRGRLVDPPKLHRFEMSTGGKIDAKLITSDERYFHIETLHGIPTRLDRQRVKEGPTELDAYAVGAVLEEKLNGRCAAKGIVMHMEGHKLVGFFDNPRKKPVPTAMNYFDMAEFAVENGLNHLLTLLLDAAKQKDPSLVRNVHETKAKRLVDLLRFYHTSGLNEDKNEAFMMLNARYHDTTAFEENRSWLEQNFPGMVKAPVKPKPAEPATAGGGAKPAPSPGTPPARDPRPISSGASKPEGDGGMSKVPRETPKWKPPADFDDWNREYNGPLSVEEARKREAKGDDCYREGKKHLTNSYEEVNPTGWAQANVDALKWMSMAFEEYDIAQIIYQRMGQRIPATLLEKARETNMIRAMCRKRAVRHE